VLQCRTNNSQLVMYWIRDFTIASSTKGVLERDPRLSLNTSTDGQFDLVINSSQSDDAGHYHCEQGFVQSARAELVLLGKCPVSNLLCFCYRLPLYVSFL